jgi:hypothetical protein
LREIATLLPKSGEWMLLENIVISGGYGIVDGWYSLLHATTASDGKLTAFSKFLKSLYPNCIDSLQRGKSQ